MSGGVRRCADPAAGTAHHVVERRAARDAQLYQLLDRRRELARLWACGRGSNRQMPTTLRQQEAAAADAASCGARSSQGLLQPRRNIECPSAHALLVLRCGARVCARPHARWGQQTAAHAAILELEQLDGRGAARGRSALGLDLRAHLDTAPQQSLSQAECEAAESTTANSSAVSRGVRALRRVQTRLPASECVKRAPPSLVLFKKKKSLGRGAR